MKTYEKFYHCRRCNQSELCRVTETDFSLFVNALVFGNSITIQKEHVC